MGVGAITSIAENRGAAAANPVSDPFALVNQAMQLRQNMQNWNSQQEAGRILAASPDMDTAVATMTKSPNAAWMLPTINQMREVQRTEAQIAQTQAATGQIGLNTAMDRFKNTVLMNPNDPKGFMNGFDAMLQSMSPLEIQENGKYLQAARSSLLDGLPSDQTAASKMFAQRVIALRLGAGMTPEAAYQTYGVPAPSYEELPADPATGAARFGMVGGLNSLFAPGTSVARTGLGGTAAPGDTSGGAIVGPGGVPTGGALGVPGATGVITGPTASDTERFKKAGEVQQDMTDATRGAPQMLNSMNTMYNMLKEFRAGGGADMWQRLAMQAQKWGMPDKLVQDLGNGSLSATEAFSAISRQFATGMMKDAVGQTGAGRLRIEAEAFLKSLNTETDPRAIIELMNNEKRSLQMSIDQAQNWPKFNQMFANKDPSIKGYVPADYLTWWGDNRGKEFGKSFAGYDLNPYDVSKVQGGSPPAAKAGIPDQWQGGNQFRYTGKETNPDKAKADKKNWIWIQR